MRVLIKISGEALSRGTSFPIDHNYVSELSRQIKVLVDGGLEVALVCGGGNICRGALFAEHGVLPNTGHEVGMLSTVINSLLVQDALIQNGQNAVLYTAREISTVGHVFDARQAQEDMRNKKVVVLSGGSGNPYFTTDTASVLRSIELSCDMMIKCTSVDGIYTADPKKDPTAQKFDTISYSDVLSKNLRVMDQTAIALAREQSVKIGICHIDTLPRLSELSKNTFTGSIIQK